VRKKFETERNYANIVAKQNSDKNIQGDGWLRKVTKSGRWVAKWVAQPACYGSSSLGSNQDISQKYKMVDISKGVANTLLPAKNILSRNDL
jgi:hypothetical protein